MNNAIRMTRETSALTLLRNFSLASSAVRSFRSFWSCSWTVFVHCWGWILRHFNTVRGRRSLISFLNPSSIVRLKDDLVEGKTKTYIVGKAVRLEIRYCRAVRKAISSWKMSSSFSVHHSQLVVALTINSCDRSSDGRWRSVPWIYSDCNW